VEKSGSSNKEEGEKKKKKKYHHSTTVHNNNIINKKQVEKTKISISIELFKYIHFKYTRTVLVLFQKE
jgi:hypothetical protein